MTPSRSCRASTVGVLGSGQLGRMFAIAARRMGYRVHTLSPDDDTPTGQVADVEISAAYDDLDAVRDFARNVDVVTFEFENIPAATAEACSDIAPVRPSGPVLHTTQHRLREKTFLAQHGFPVVPFVHVRSLAELEAALAQTRLPAVLKTAGWGYDGKGQCKITSAGRSAGGLAIDAGARGRARSFHRLRARSLGRRRPRARRLGGRFRRDGQRASPITSSTLRLAPAAGPPAVVARSPEIAARRAGTARRGGGPVRRVLSDSRRPPVGQRTGSASAQFGPFDVRRRVTSQFEQQLRAICGLPLGSTELLRPAAMANLLGDLWQAGRAQLGSRLPPSRK